MESVAGVYEKFTHINEIMMSDSDLAELLDRAQNAKSVEDLTNVEKMRIQSWNRFLFNTWLSANIAYDNGKLAEITYLSIFEDIRGEIDLCGPVTRSLWRDLVHQYSDKEFNHVSLTDSQVKYYKILYFFNGKYKLISNYINLI